MGSELCTYILVVPEKITDAHVASARKYALRTRKTLEEVLVLLKNSALDSVSDLENLVPEDIKDLLDSYFSFGEPCGVEEIKTLLFELSDEKLNEIIEFLMEPETRDSNSRFAKIGGQTFRIIVAGDQTWGDTPDGTGYQTCKTIMDLGLDRCFDIQ